MSNVVVLHDGFWTGTMRREEADVKVLFLAMMYEAMKGGKQSGGVVQGTHDFWAFLCGWEKEPDGGVAKVAAALERLMSPDPSSTSKNDNGRRVIAHEADGKRHQYLIVNFESFRQQRLRVVKQWREQARYHEEKRNAEKAEKAEKAEPVNPAVSTHSIVESESESESESEKESPQKTVGGAGGRKTAPGGTKKPPPILSETANRLLEVVKSTIYRAHPRKRDKTVELKAIDTIARIPKRLAIGTDTKGNPVYCTDPDSLYAEVLSMWVAVCPMPDADGTLNYGLLDGEDFYWLEQIREVHSLLKVKDGQSKLQTIYQKWRRAKLNTREAIMARAKDNL